MRIKTNDKYTSMLLKNRYENIKNEIHLSAILNRVYSEKLTGEIIRTKVTNQFNSMETSISRINPKFSEKAKNFDKMKQQMMETLDHYELNLTQLSQIHNAEIEELILKKVEIESKLLMAILTKEQLYRNDRKKQTENDKNIILHGINHVVEKIKNKAKEKKQVDVNLINRIQDGKEVEKEIKEKLQASEEFRNNQAYIRKLEKEIKIITKKITNLNEQTASKIFDAMETGDKMLSTQIKRPHTIKRITKFFTNRFNTYHVIIKNVIEPVNQRIDEFKVNELKKVNIQPKEFDLPEFETKIQEKQDLVFQNIDNKIICKELEII